jgi:hypothetical protein
MKEKMEKKKVVIVKPCVLIAIVLVNKMVSFAAVCPIKKPNVRI